MLGQEMSFERYVEFFIEQIVEAHDRWEENKNSSFFESVQRLSDDLYQAYCDQRTIFICGNGGSASTASHACQDLAKSTLDSQDFSDNSSMTRLRVISLTDNTPHLLALANDCGYESVFVEQLKNLAQKSDMLIALSGSGNSQNVLRAARWANDHNMSTWGMTGFDGGELMRVAQNNVHVSIDDMGLVESTHLLIFHWLVDDLYARMHGVGRYYQSEA